MMRYLAILLTIGLFLTACDDNSTDDKREVVYEKKTCYDKSLIIDIGEYKINAKREGLTLNLDDGEQINNLHMKCDIEEVENVESARWPNFSVSASNLKALESSYGLYNHLINQYYETRVVLNDGIQRFQTKNAQLYVLPESTSKSMQGEQVLINCSGDEENRTLIGAYNCIAGYPYSDNLFLWYRFFRKEYSENQFIQADQNFRRRLESMIIETPNQGEQK